MTYSEDKIFKKGSATFSFCALFFPKIFYQDVAKLYAWLRFCDDWLDTDRYPTPCCLEALASMKHIISLMYKKENFLSDPFFYDYPFAIDPFHGLAAIIHHYDIPMSCWFDFLNGLTDDIQHTPKKTLEDLLQYAYQVAGVLGVILAIMMQVHTSDALPHACALGIAMQLTNIARDVYEDAGHHRIYLPQTWLIEKAVTQEDFFAMRNPLAAQELRIKLLRLADEYYTKAQQGLPFLKPRFSFVVLLAAKMYQNIGHQILRTMKRHQNPLSALQTRSYTTHLQKFILTFKAVYLWKKIQHHRTFIPTSHHHIANTLQNHYQKAIL